MSQASEETSGSEALPASEELAGLLEKARQLSAQTRSLIDQALARGISHRLKADSTFVTEVDLAVEEHVRSALSGWFPSHGILGEEFDACNPDADYQWIIDPIDGTRSLRHRVPLFGTVLALHFRGHPVLGVIDLPGLDRCYSGALGLGSLVQRAQTAGRRSRSGTMLSSRRSCRSARGPSSTRQARPTCWNNSIGPTPAFGPTATASVTAWPWRDRWGP